MVALSPSVEMDTAASGSDRTMSAVNFPGRTVLPSSSILAWKAHLIDTSRSVACMTVLSPSVSTRMPERIGNVDRADNALLTEDRASRRSSRAIENFIYCSFLLYIHMQ